MTRLVDFLDHLLRKWEARLQKRARQKEAIAEEAQQRLF